MAWDVIARKEFDDVVDPRGGKAGLVAVALVFVLGGYVLPMNARAPTSADYASYMTDAVGLVVPLFGLLLGYKAIVADRSAGRLTLLFTLPYSRRDALVGKYATRAGLLIAAVAGGVLAGSWLVYYPFGSFDAGVVLGYLAVTCCYGLAFLGIGFAISTLTTSNRVASGATFGVFFLFVVVWGQLRGALALALDYVGLADGSLPDWALFLHGLEPSLLYGRVVTGFYTEAARGPYFGPDAAWYLGAWPALVALLAWTVLPIALGYRRFEVTDL
ncbi:ABC transporter permease subunit [Halorubellus sp. PRR65]|uniref:ABC transporter permease n=1 Tax=Halorubellus sp. PRR65 TaxID=3098148 RepID=UPI002B25F10F|nr:ABC transporter permease subunit [Halorubellus sp. PRR65]